MRLLNFEAQGNTERTLRLMRSSIVQDKNKYLGVVILMDLPRYKYSRIEIAEVFGV
jgi:hypothetical protein